jgi:hypothetical protein
MFVQSQPAITSLPFERIYAEVQQFYAHQSQLLDSGQAEAWAETFTVDGSFAPPSLPQPVRGRVDLADGVRKAAAGLAETGEVHRHLFSTTSVRPSDDGSITVTSYTQVIATGRDQGPRLHLMCVCHDVLVREGGELRVRERRVTRDDRR